MEHKLPYYMAYPMDLKEYGEEKEIGVMWTT